MFLNRYLNDRLCNLHSQENRLVNFLQFVMDYDFTLCVVKGVKNFY